MNYEIICGISISNIINRVICFHEENIETSMIFDYSIKKIYNMFSELIINFKYELNPSILHYSKSKAA